MNEKKTYFAGIVAALLVGAGLLFLFTQGTRAQGEAPQAPISADIAVGTAFSFQGRLDDGDSPANGSHDFQFLLFDAASGGSQVGSTQTKSGVAVTDGLFTVQLDFGAVFNSNTARWLQVKVRTSGSGSYTTLSPRQTLTPAPFALWSQKAPWSGLTGVPAGISDGDNDTLGGLGCSNGQVAKWNGSAWVCGADNTGSSAWADITGKPAGLNDGDDDTLGSLSCANGQIAKWNGSAWTCATSSVAWGDISSIPASIADGDNQTLNLNSTTLSISDGNSVDLKVLGSQSTAAGIDATVNGGTLNTASANVATVSGGMDNTAEEFGATVSGGRNNTASGIETVIGGGNSNTVTANHATVGGGQNNTSSGTLSLVGGGYSNVASGAGAAVGGGGYDGSTLSGNQAKAPASTIGGGYGNTIEAAASYATVAGGHNNTASGFRSAIGGGGTNTATKNYTTVAGGIQNTASGDTATIGGGWSNLASGEYTTIGGGFDNSATGVRSAVGGGEANSASGDFAVVPGGLFNVAQGKFSFAAGRRAKAIHDGSFVWADGYDVTLSSTATNQFMTRAVGGFKFLTNTAGTTGCYINAGGGTMNCTSDRNMKEQIEEVDPVAVLEAVASLPIATWNYTTQDQGIRHMGPMAQDFATAFGLGEDDVSISMVDADGVSLAAIQGLYLQNQAQSQLIHTQQETIDAQNSLLAELLQRVELLEADNE